MTNNETNSADVDKTACKVIDRIPNGVHLYRIRDALRNGHAAVMVGSGFSFNAEHGNRLLTWAGLMGELLTDLYPDSSGRELALQRFGGTSGMLRLAEEYSVVLGRAHLDARIHQLLPDVGITAPGELHTQLLSLPWVDVYTTNYDTLLERALEVDRKKLKPKIVRRYQIVLAANHVPFSRSNGRPRVVKLHGSLRTGSPLILTEEDYRRYPTRFAPFVSMVQQSMLENVFCVIGFSGDDPNFLQWTGWVRDRLGDQTPPIYLVTLEPVSEGQRLILERRSIFPIPIAELGRVENKIDYAVALNKLFAFWKGEPRVREGLWPYQGLPAAYREKAAVEELTEWMRFAKKNRLEYPGWLVAPEANRELAKYKCGNVFVNIKYRQNFEQLSPTLRVAYLYEVNWISETILELIDPTQALDYEAALLASSTNFSFPSGPTKGTSDIEPTNSEFQHMWGRLALAVLRNARERQDVKKFDVWKKKLADISTGTHDSEIICSSLYEETLRQLEELNRPAAFKLLKHWSTIDVAADPYWLVRAGALYGEFGAVRKGLELVRRGLHKIREVIQAEGETTFFVSREHWAERIMDAMSSASPENATWPRALPKQIQTGKDDFNGSVPSPEVSLTTLVLREESASTLAPTETTEVYRDGSAQDVVGHPNHQIGLLVREISRATANLNLNEVDFDDVEPINRGTMSEPLPEALHAASAFCRLVETVAYVPALGALGLSGNTMVKCFRILCISEPLNKCLRHLLRANSGEALSSMKPLSPANVARLSVEDSRQLFEKSILSINQTLGRASSNFDHSAKTSIKFSLELASRVLFRLMPQEADNAIKSAIQWHENKALQNEFSLYEPFALFFRRAIRAASISMLALQIPRLLTLNPNPSVFSRFREWPIIVESLPIEANFLLRGVKWSEIVETIFLQGREPSESTDESKAFHVARLDWLYRNGAMSRLQQEKFATFIWSGTSSGALPKISGFYVGAAMLWPAPSKGRTASIFKKWLLDEPLPNLVQVSELNGKQQRSMSSVRETLLLNILITGNNNIHFSWSTDDMVILVGKLEKWWVVEGRDLSTRVSEKPEDTFARQLLMNRLRLIAHIAQRIIAPQLPKERAVLGNVSDWLCEMWQASSQLGHPLVQLLFAGLIWWPERDNIAVDIALESITSCSDANDFATALNAVGYWLVRLRESSEASSHYVTFLMSAVRWRARGRLGFVIENITELLKLGDWIHFEKHGRLLCSMLLAILTELQGNEPVNGVFDFEVRPALRVAVVQNLIALGNEDASIRSSDDWKNAIELARADPLLDVRNLLHP